ncbi:MAG: hypothetical protein EAZ29_13440 [Runella slithyformis]|nr:MAG: hypothetical protein EAZ29_13440 [Runella slithyformis]
MRKILLLFCLATLLGMTAAVAQTIKGKIIDQAGLPLVGATAQIVGTTQGAVANRDGLFEIPNVGAGTYKVKISFIGYQSVTQDAQAGQMLTITLNDDALDMNEVVVTGSFDPRSKLESSVAITTLNARNIDMRAPRGTGDLLQSVPGMFVDNSAGEVGNRVIARGLSPVGNDQIGFTYVSLQEEGLPVMGAQMGFAVVDMYHRTDLTTARMESIRGGSSSIVAPNAPGGIFNFISKTGGPVFSGSGRLTAGVYNNGNNIVDRIRRYHYC